MKERFTRIHLIVMDSVGIGEAPDAAAFHDIGSDTLGHIASSRGRLHVPNLRALGLANIRPFPHLEASESPAGAYGKMREASVGKDTMTGHWEMAGLRIDKPFQVYPDGFPEPLIRELEARTGRKVIGNKVASGTAIIDELGPEQMETGALIVYTSADPVLQIAAHEDVIPLEELYAICAIARELTLDPKYLVGRVIARPYVGAPGRFQRTSNRHDYALKPFGRTVLDELKARGLDVIAIGKISDIFNGEGITESVRTVDNMDGMDKLIEVAKRDFRGLSFLNLVDFDALYGHRRDPEGYGRALEEFDARLPELFSAMTESDLLIITADHGNDPTFHGTDHTREFVPLLLFTPGIAGGALPDRETFSDIGATIAENFGVEPPAHGTSFLRELQGRGGRL